MTRRRDNIISLDRGDGAFQLALDWERDVVSELMRNAERIKIVLRSKPSAETVLKMWRIQHDDFGLLCAGTADAELWSRRSSALIQAEARMSALMREIELHNARVRGKVN